MKNDKESAFKSDTMFRWRKMRGDRRRNSGIIFRTDSTVMVGRNAAVTENARSG